MRSREAAISDVGRHQLFIESVGVWVVDVVVDTGLVVEARWLPELLHVVVRVVVVKHELGQVADQEESQEVGLETGVERLEVRAVLLIALVPKNLKIETHRNLTFWMQSRVPLYGILPLGSGRIV